MLGVLACATVALAPMEGYLFEVHGQLAKVAPALLAVAWVVIRVRERRAPNAHPVHAVLALFAVVLLASAAVHAGGRFTVDYTVRWLPFLLLTVIIADIAARELPIRLLLGAAAAGATAAAGSALYAMFAEGQPRASGPVEDPNDLAYFLVVAVPMLIAVLPARPPTPPLSTTASVSRAAPTLGTMVPSGRWAVIGVRVVAVLAGATLVAGAMATLSRGGFLALTAAVGWLLLRRVLPLRVLAGALAVVALIGALAMSLAGPALAKALGEKSFIAGSNVDARELRWQAAARMLAENPVLGVGPGGFRSDYAAASHNAEVGEQTPVAHNMYLEVAAELGLPGFLLFIGLLVLAAVATERALRASRDRRPMVAVQAALIAVAVASTFLSQQYYLPLWLLIGLAVAAESRLHERRGSADAGAPGDQ
ncbi:O-antigen ligase family protein [Actinokineospora alba]|uniref:O-antigen ligase family protein n=1 Tax=Actinokineospora alba TaxID=504798 RepID=UPI001E2A714D|nr:O-antigen ligase family protein [Actinokineospora alba]